MNELTKLHERVASLESTQAGIKEDQREIKDSLKEQINILKDIRDELSIYRTTIRLIKLIGLTLAFLLAFKFGDIKQLWKL